MYFVNIQVFQNFSIKLGPMKSAGELVTDEGRKNGYWQRIHESLHKQYFAVRFQEKIANHKLN